MGDGMNSTTDQTETKRARVRRILLDPLGFRFRKGVDGDEAKRALNRIADDLAYMADDRLAALRDMLATKGQGSDRNFWPDHATFIAFAEVVEPRPIEELPALLSWFGSVEGPAALAAGVLVETWQFIGRRKKPPVTPQERTMVAEAAAMNARRLTIIAERREAGWTISDEDRDWERRYLACRAHCEGIVARERTARGHDDGGVAA